jgi:3-carboxy-cis,cis-muconate cycloisomerase
MSHIFEGPLTTPEILEVFGERNFLEAMLRFEASLARAQASVGLIPEAAAQSIIGTCKVELFDVAKIVREGVRAGNIAIPLVKSLKETVALFNQDAAAYVHFGASLQDLIDTALTLVTRTALDLIGGDVSKAIDALLKLARRHAADPVLSRTLMQPVSVTSFGLQCAGWAAPLVRSQQRLQLARARALSLQRGGAVGGPAQVQKEGRNAGPEVLGLMAGELQLLAPDFACQPQRDEWVALGCELGLLAGSLGKMARELALMSQFEVGELAEPGSSVMPDKRTSVACAVALAAAQRAPQRVAALLAAMPQEHERALGNWQAELAEWPGLVMSVHGAARAMAQVLSGLRVDPQRMRANLDTVRAAASPEDAEQWFSSGLVRQAAERVPAQIRLLTEDLAALDKADETGGTSGANAAL